MQKKEIKYIGFYDVLDSNGIRACAMAAVNKMDYICDGISKAGFSVHLVSPSWFVASEKTINYKGKSTLKLSESKKLTLAPSFSTSKKITGYFKIIFSLCWLFCWLLLNVKKNEKILVYHAPWLALPVLWAKKLKGFHLILEVEEVYSDISSIHSYFDRLENKIVDKADSFLFSTELLAKRVNTNKPYIIIYGNYKVYETLALPPDDGKIHLVYAGIIDTDKAGAFNAIESALYLPENYVMHIIGFGDIDTLQLRIAEINKTSKCKVSYDGLKKGDDFVKFCQSCHIGLSTQKMDGDYLNSSFPSKILTYLGMGLNVVSCDVKCVSNSNIGKFISYYKIDHPKMIAGAIIKANINNDGALSNLVKNLHYEFLFNLKKIMNDL
jgi:hypothetical protein